MSEHARNFIGYLRTLKECDPGALAALRHSLAFAPGNYPKVYPYVERFVGAGWNERDARRLARYAVAGLFARHSQQADHSFAYAFGDLMRRRKSGSIEGRFVALLGADSENIFDYLRQAISLLAADGIGLDYAALLDDLSVWMNPHADRDRIRQRWARDFYRALSSASETETTNAS